MDNCYELNQQCTIWNYTGNPLNSLAKSQLSPGAEQLVPFCSKAHATTRLARRSRSRNSTTTFKWRGKRWRKKVPFTRRPQSVSSRPRRQGDTGSQHQSAATKWRSQHELHGWLPPSAQPPHSSLGSPRFHSLPSKPGDCTAHGHAGLPCVDLGGEEGRGGPGVSSPTDQVPH